MDLEEERLNLLAYLVTIHGFLQNNGWIRSPLSYGKITDWSKDNRLVSTIAPRVNDSFKLVIYGRGDVFQWFPQDRPPYGNEWCPLGFSYGDGNEFNSRYQTFAEWDAVVRQWILFGIIEGDGQTDRLT